MDKALDDLWIFISRKEVVGVIMALCAVVGVYYLWQWMSSTGKDDRTYYGDNSVNQVMDGKNMDKLKYDPHNMLNSVNGPINNVAKENWKGGSNYKPYSGKSKVDKTPTSTPTFTTPTPTFTNPEKPILSLQDSNVVPQTRMNPEYRRDNSFGGADITSNINDSRLPNSLDSKINSESYMNMAGNTSLRMYTQRKSSRPY